VQAGTLKKWKWKCGKRGEKRNVRQKMGRAAREGNKQNGRKWGRKGGKERLRGKEGEGGRNEDKWQWLVHKKSVRNCGCP